MILLSIVGLLFAAGAEIADAQIVNPNDVLSYGSATGDFWGLSRDIRCQKALLYGWHNPGQLPSSCVALMTTVPRFAQYNNQLGGFFNRDGFNMNYGRGGRWPSVAAQGIQTIGDVIMNGRNNGTIREVERDRNRLEQQRIDGDQEIARQRLTGDQEIARRRLSMEERRQDYELKQLEGHYTSKQMGPVSQPLETNRTLHNDSSCAISVYRNNQLEFILLPKKSILISGDRYSWESDGCDVQAGEITVLPSRR